MTGGTARDLKRQSARRRIQGEGAKRHKEKYCRSRERDFECDRRNYRTMCDRGEVVHIDTDSEFVGLNKGERERGR